MLIFKFLKLACFFQGEKKISDIQCGIRLWTPVSLTVKCIILAQNMKTNVL